MSSATKLNPEVARDLIRSLGSRDPTPILKLRILKLKTLKTIKFRDKIQWFCEHLIIIKKTEIHLDSDQKSWSFEKKMPISKLTCW